MFGSHISKLCATKSALRLSVVKPRLIDNQSEKGKRHNSKQANYLKRGKTRVTMSRLVLVLNLIGWKKWRELSGPVTRQGKVKLKPFRITFDTQLKLALKEVLFLQSLRENDFRVFAFHIAGCLIEVWLVITNLKQNQYQLKLQHHGHRHRWHHQVNKTNNIKNTNDYSIIIMITIIINSNNKTSLSWKITTISFFI